MVPYLLVVVAAEGFTKWDQLVFEGNLTLNEFLEAFKARTGANVGMLYHPVASNDKSVCSGMFLYVLRWCPWCGAMWCTSPHAPYAHALQVPTGEVGVPRGVL